MADPIVVSEDVTADETQGNVGMGDEVVNGDAAANGEEDMDVADISEYPVHTAFLEYLKSPIVQIQVGQGVDSVIVTAHQDLLTRSPYFEQACAEFTSDVRRIDLPDEDPEALGSFIEYLYRDDYFPRSLDGTLETDPSLPAIDNDGQYLLKHARVYTLAKKLFMPNLKSLAHSKIHRTTSTARGEISYARYVYGNTSTDDATIRKPVAAFWATRSHVLRHEAEEEFRAMCLEYPQFGFDVLSMVLDQKEKRQGGGVGPVGVGPSVSVETPGTGGKGRKRARVSGA